MTVDTSSWPEPNSVSTPPSQPAMPPQVPSFGPKPTAQGVRGYRNLTDGQIETVNSLKMLEELVAARWGEIGKIPDADRRWLAVARTHFQEGFTALIRSITQPRDPFQIQLENNAQDFIEGVTPRS